MPLEQAEKVRENRIRRAAMRQGLQLHRSRRRDPRALDYGAYWLTDSIRGRVVYGGEPGSGRYIKLDEIEAYLTREDR